MGEPGTADTLRAAPRSCGRRPQRMEAILDERSLSEEQVVERVGADVEVFLAAMATLDRELRSPG